MSFFKPKAVQAFPARTPKSSLSMSLKVEAKAIAFSYHAIASAFPNNSPSTVANSQRGDASCLILRIECDESRSQAASLVTDTGSGPEATGWRISLIIYGVRSHALELSCRSQRKQSSKEAHWAPSKATNSEVDTEPSRNQKPLVKPQQQIFCDCQQLITNN